MTKSPMTAFGAGLPFPDLVRDLPEIDLPLEGVRGWLFQGADRQLERVPRPLQVPLPPHLPAHLQQRTGVGQVVPVSVGIGAVCGGLAGSYGLLVFAAASPAGAVLGGVSSAVIGGLGGFLGASFVEIVRTSVREAIAAERLG